MSSWRRILLPFSWIYGMIMRIRNFLYDHGIILKSRSFPVASIGVGNLTVGGTGKTPHIEYLIRLLKDRKRTATLSRGYGRSTKGFILASSPTTASIIGDEPMQYYTKFPEITVSVGEDRGAAMDHLLRIQPPPEVILLDDNYQHRAVKAGLQILLIDFDTLEKTDFLLPAGNLREPSSGIKRADIVIVTKTPSILVPIERKRILNQLEVRQDQPVFFSFIRYGEFVRVHGRPDGMMMGAKYYLENRFTILLVTGIANPSGLIEYLRRNTDKLEMLIFPDHHAFDLKDMSRIRETFDNIANQNKIIVTTEKDAMRLRHPDIDSLTRQLPFFYVPIEIDFHQEGNRFDGLILDHVRKTESDR